MITDSTAVADPVAFLKDAFGNTGFYQSDYLRMLNCSQMYSPDGEPKWKAAEALNLVHRLSSPTPPTVASVIEAMESFIKVCPRPAPINTTASVNDQLNATALSAPVMATSISFMVVQDTERLAARLGISKSDAEATMEYLHSNTGYTKNLLLAMQVINRFARQNGITPTQAEIVLRN